ncbi:transcription antitermination factor NusB [Oxalobacter vibrioformis]|uniref:Transcription antitermination protein NusB n=1 Tax=Oxalobacter vibrioformis TaxID=933080 RepID=A0A9E9M115_9BURK|nr:transcription antitermination factor NusB [Oxalobacter vibrioformis]NLC24400.1 transcription antitermination factor NusB [Oxalobacter sp.]WAW11197.1 transcription antitermination factor NusB [Oxalobacter vibrioformis]
MNAKSIHANPNKNRSPRRRSREFALQALYQWLLNQDDAPVIIEHIRQAHGFDKADTEHFVALVSGAIQQADTLREEIAPLLDRTIEELSPVEYASLLLGAHELTSHPEIPYRVVINEAVELTKSFGGIDGHKFVNGVLDKLAAKLRAVEVDADRAK